ncbi:MAG: virulence RhuM family protein [Candidatus Cloacimonetes bacterium]|nr:virulence RhuM family protein [Candidatus Cloacimonadota bacterium]MCF7815103.1 virulence RhuM family protein [Candidatus Cloacimonadota bacterium]MCF7868052.1 virulence RhuM family protein [Candidatus Cloacimonadota bacterium]MCF7883972.1 virulence RhuM family protein [Candidatus Cloacimonadota bacterium]
MNDFDQKDVIIYQSSDGKTSVEVNLRKETVWLNQKQMGILFDKNYKTISRHINNIFKQGELERDSTVSYFETVQNEGGRKVVRKLEFYNLDMIISVGYRVNSKRGTQFRIWATNVLKDHLINGYSIYRQRLENQTEKIKELNNTILLIEDVVKQKQLTTNEAKGLIFVVSDYIRALDILDDYDHQRLELSSRLSKNLIRKLDYNEITKAINELRNYFRNKGEKVELFGVEKDQSLKSSISAIYQTFDGKDLYPLI